MGTKKLDLESAEAEWVDIGTLTPWDKNPRKNDGAVKSVADSIKRFGWASPILVREQDNVIIAGHTRYKAAKLLGLDKVLVRRLALDPAQAKALALADNKLNELAEWDNEMLAEVLSEVQLSGEDIYDLGWSSGQIEEFINNLDETEPEEETIEPPEQPYGSGQKVRADSDVQAPDSTPVVAADVQMVQLFFTKRDHMLFLEFCRRAKLEIGAENMTDIVFRVFSDRFAEGEELAFNEGEE